MNAVFDTNIIIDALKGVPDADAEYNCATHQLLRGLKG